MPEPARLQLTLSGQAWQTPSQTAAHLTRSVVLRSIRTKTNYKAGGSFMSRTWMVKTIPTNPAVSNATPRERGPTSLSCWSVFFQCTRPRTILFVTCPMRTRAATVRRTQLGSCMSDKGLPAFLAPAAGSLGCAAASPEPYCGLALSAGCLRKTQLDRGRHRWAAHTCTAFYHYLPQHHVTLMPEAAT